MLFLSKLMFASQILTLTFCVLTIFFNVIFYKKITMLKNQKLSVLRFLWEEAKQKKWSSIFYLSSAALAAFFCTTTIILLMLLIIKRGV